MLNRLLKTPILSCSIIFVICSVARLIEYFYIRTDETFLSEIGNSLLARSLLAFLWTEKVTLLF